MKTPKQVLIEAKQVISDPNHWTTNAMARDKNWLEVHAKSSRACKFCSIGAIARVSKNEAEEYLAEGAISKILPNGYGGNVGRFNDSNSHEEVMTAFDKAIESLE